MRAMGFSRARTDGESGGVGAGGCFAVLGALLRLGNVRFADHAQKHDDGAARVVDDDGGAARAELAAAAAGLGLTDA